MSAKTGENQMETCPTRTTDVANGCRFAIPLAEGVLCNHFGHCEAFALLDVEQGATTVSCRQDLVPPAHEPGVLPRWLRDQGVKKVIAGGMGSRAQSLFKEAGIDVVTGAPAAPPEFLVASYLDGTLETGANGCDH